MPESAKVPGGRSPVRFSRIEQPRTHMYIAEQLRREITLGVLPTGEALPPERELAAMLAAATTDDALFTSLDTQFHLAVATAAHNRFFAEAVERVRLSLYEAIMLLPESPLWQQRSLREHQRILTALEAGDPQAARQAMLA